MEELKIYQTDPWMVPYFIDDKIPYLYTHGSTLRTTMQCPRCGYVKERTIDALHRYGFACPLCSDGVSYPNKFMLSLFLQLHLPVEVEKTFEWSLGKKYDDYIVSYNLIVENHGEQHYKNVSGKIYKKLDEQIKIDKLKKEMANKNGIKHYVEIDCRKSDMDWIKTSVMNSDLPSILSFSEGDIDWCECDKLARSSLVVRACDLWQHQHKSVVEIAQELHICRLTVTVYLKQGAKVGWCDYDPQIESKKILSMAHTPEVEKRKCKPIAVYNTIGMIAVFDSAIQLSELSDSLFGVHLSRPMIANVCNEKNTTNAGLRLKFISKEQYSEYYNDFGGNVNPALFNPNIKYSSQEKPVMVLLNDEIVDIFSSRKEASVVLTEMYGMVFTVKRITNVCLKIQKQCNGFVFQNITREEYEQYKMITNKEKI